MSEDVNGDINETLRDNIGTVLHEFEENGRRIVRSLENLTKKHTNARYAVIFTETCKGYVNIKNMLKCLK